VPSHTTPTKLRAAIEEAIGGKIPEDVLVSVSFSMAEKHAAFAEAIAPEGIRWSVSGSGSDVIGFQKIDGSVGKNLTVLYIHVNIPTLHITPTKAQEYEEAALRS
jgi:hypothetical protein